MITTTTRLLACGCIEQREIRLGRPDPWARTRPCGRHAAPVPAEPSGQPGNVPPHLRRHVRALKNRAHVRRTWRKREPALARTIETELTAILTGEMTS